MRKKRWFFVLTIAAVSLTFTLNAQAAEKLKVASAVRLSPVFYLPILGAEAGGSWKQNGLDAEWTPFGSGAAMYRAVAAGETKIGLSMVPAEFQAVAAGIPVVIISDLHPKDDFYIWVGTKSRFKEPKDLKGGAKVGVSRFGGTEHAYGRMIAKVLGLEKELKLISTGGIPESLGALKAQTIDGVLLSPHQMIKFKVAGEVKELVAVVDFRPREWASYVIFADRGFASKNADVTKRAVRSLLQGMEHIRKNPKWTIEKMKELNGYSEEEAKMIYQVLDFTRDGKMSKKGLENVRNFLIEYGIVSKDKAPRVEEMYTDQFTE